MTTPIGWNDISTAPKNTPVLVYYITAGGEIKRVIAELYEAGTIQAGDECEYDDVDDDGYFLNDEWMQECESNPDCELWALETEPLAWHPLPEVNV